jgi:cysteine-rich repeat protein
MLSAVGCRARVLLAVGVCAGCPAEPPAFPSASTGATTGDPGDASGADASMPATEGTGSASASASASAGEDTTRGESPTTTDDDPTTSDPSGDPSPTCGNGALDGSEMCDDGNASELDGCTTSCEVGPTGVDIDVDGGMVTLVNYGGPMAMVVEADCPDGQVLMGLEVHTNDMAIVGVAGRCGALSLVDANPTSVDVGAGADLMTIGSGQGNLASAECPSGQVLAQVSAAGNSPSLTGLQGTCRELVITGVGSGQALSLQAGDVLEQLGPQMPFSPSSCQRNQVATAIRVPLSGDLPAGFGLRCAPIALVYP